MGEEVKPEPCDTCPEDKKKECWSRWGVCDEYIDWADGETERMNQEIDNPKLQKLVDESVRLE